MPKVALFLPLLDGGGAERVFVILAHGLTNAGHDVDLVLAQATGDYLSLLPEGVNVVDLGGHRILSSVRPLARYLRQVRPDVLFSTLDHANLVALWAKWWSRTSTPVVMRIASTLSVYIATSDYAQDLWLRYLIPVFYRFADGIMANSQVAADDAARVAQIKRERIKVIYNPSVTANLESLQMEQPDHPYFALGVPVILGVGRLTPAKDFTTLIQAFAQVRQRQATKLVILGKGPEHEALLNLIEELNLTDDVSLPGFAQNPYAYMHHANVFVLSSRYEGLPNVLIEALACGCSPISTDSPGGSAEILGYGDYGRLTPVGDVDALTEAILETLENPIPVEKLQSRAQEFTLEATLPHYLNLLKLDAE